MAGSEKAWHDGLDPFQRRMVYLLVRSVTSIFHVSFAEIIAQDRHPTICCARNALTYSLYYDASMKVSQIGRIIRRRDAQIHDVIKVSKERRVTTPFKTTRTKLTRTFARLNSETLDGSPILTRDDADAFLSIPDEDRLYFGR